MTTTISTEAIQLTKAFQSLEKVYQPMVLRLENRKNLTNAILVYKNTGALPTHFSRNNLKIFNEIIQKK